LRVLVADEAGRRVSAPGITRWLTRVAPPRARGVVSVALVSDARVRELNRKYRRRDYPTDVLSFSSGRTPDLKVGPTYRGARHAKSYVGPSFSSGVQQQYLGDIVIARGIARRQAREAGHTELTELRVLALHGLLHLLGYDHERDAGRMARVERLLRARGGLREGLIERGRK
jgi:probable rRNA maturation factor